MNNPTQRFYTPGDAPVGATYEEFEAERIRIDEGFKKVQDELDAGGGGGGGQIIIPINPLMMKNSEAPYDYLQIVESGGIGMAAVPASKMHLCGAPVKPDATIVKPRIYCYPFGAAELNLSVTIAIPGESPMKNWDVTGGVGEAFTGDKEDHTFTAGEKTQMDTFKHIWVIVSSTIGVAIASLALVFD